MNRTLEAAEEPPPSLPRSVTSSTAGERDSSPLVRLLRYVGRHRRYAVLTGFFGVIGFMLSFVYPWLIGSVVDLVVQAPGPGRDALARTKLMHYTELAALAAVMHAVVVYGRGHFNVHLGDGIVADLRRELFEHLQKLSLGFYARERTGAILSRVLHDVHEATSLIYTGLIVAGMDAVQLVIAIAFLAGISWRLSLACVLLFPLYAIVFFLMNPRVRRASERMQSHFGRLSANAAERLAGQALIKVYTAEDREVTRFGQDVARHHQLVIAQSHEGHLVASAGEVLVHFGTTIVIGLGGLLVLQGQMSAGMMTRFLGYVLIMFGPVRRFAELNITYQSSLSAMQRVFRIFEIRPNVVEPARPTAFGPVRGHIRFETVRFRYSDEGDEGASKLEQEESPKTTSGRAAGAWVLDDVTLEAHPGERIAIVGPSGAGKTTLLSLLPRLYDVAEGRVTVDGRDVRDYSLRALRSAIAIVQQESFVFTGTVRDNIAYGRMDASDEEVVRAAQDAHAHEFIERLPDGYLSRLGERGVNLSGGQRQRISIARALLKNPRILILDEATSSLDAESEAIVQHALEGLMRSRTCFVIAHRLSTIRNADRIFVLKGGRLVENGTHSELLSRGGVYAHLVQHQAVV